MPQIPILVALQHLTVCIVVNITTPTTAVTTLLYIKLAISLNSRHFSLYKNNNTTFASSCHLKTTTELNVKTKKISYHSTK